MTVNSLIHTSVEDVRSTLPHISDLGLLKAALKKAQEFEHQTRAKLIAARIRMLEKDK